jgi:Holliday junction resolvase RusA-like endonuclease
VKLIATLTSPLFVHTTKSQTAKGKFIFNLNNYRNACYMKLNNSKKAYKAFMEAQITALPYMHKIAVRFTLYPKTQRRTDTPNVCSIHDKYFMDALVEFGKLSDDTFDYYVETGYKFGHVDKDNPRVKIEIYEI